MWLKNVLTGEEETNAELNPTPNATSLCSDAQPKLKFWNF